MLAKSIKPEEEKEWENPKDPEAPSDQRDKEQIERQLKEAERRKENLTPEDESDTEQKN
ncbi:hypothetical protein KXQ82_14820 [Mucilaginibacter sp. HMF5004]|uniref:hypothetical protein n=1 Tax=Mucilaginibacter rivuli TaxID=2857527 RepID=UPI001C6059EC|nr:hypothetical protein [Mucilaginibacter rivuli]MBW4890998.1 hypothetical protein [Mucilaginibacter rivuli]